MSDIRLDAAAKKFQSLEKRTAKLENLLEEILAGQKQMRTHARDAERALQRKADFLRELSDAANDNHHWYIKNLNELLKERGLPTIEEHANKKHSQQQETK